MLFDDTISLLEKKLKEPLPGIISHKKFMPVGRYELSLKVAPDVRNSAVLVLFYPVDGKAYFPLILRPKYDGSHGGQMALPGGKEEPADEDLIRTALREAQEEVGVKALDVQVLGRLSRVYIPVSHFMVHPVVGFLDYKPDFFPDAREVAKIYFTDLDDLLIPNTIKHKTIRVAGRNLSVPGYEIQDNWVWGATSFVLSELVDIIRS